VQEVYSPGFQTSIRTATCMVSSQRVSQYSTCPIIPHIKIITRQDALRSPSKMPTTLLLDPAFGLAFCSTAVELGPEEEQLAVPHSQPLGQQFPPTLAAQLDQPVAHVPVGLATVAADPMGTTIVTPLLRIVVELMTGQEVVSQFLPVRQHPP
jgi:hypothetical protein